MSGNVNVIQKKIIWALVWEIVAIHELESEKRNKGESHDLSFILDTTIIGTSPHTALSFSLKGTMEGPTSSLTIVPPPLLVLVSRLLGSLLFSLMLSRREGRSAETPDLVRPSIDSIGLAGDAWKFMVS